MRSILVVPEADVQWSIQNESPGFSSVFLRSARSLVRVSFVVDTNRGWFAVFQLVAGLLMFLFIERSVLLLALGYAVGGSVDLVPQFRY